MSPTEEHVYRRPPRRPTGRSLFQPAAGALSQLRRRWRHGPSTDWTNRARAADSCSGPLLVWRTANASRPRTLIDGRRVRPAVVYRVGRCSWCAPGGAVARQLGAGAAHCSAYRVVALARTSRDDAPAFLAARRRVAAYSAARAAEVRRHLAEHRGTHQRTRRSRELGTTAAHVRPVERPAAAARRRRRLGGLSHVRRGLTSRRLAAPPATASGGDGRTRTGADGAASQKRLPARVVALTPGGPVSTVKAPARRYCRQGSCPGRLVAERAGAEAALLNRPSPSEEVIFDADRIPTGLLKTFIHLFSLSFPAWTFKHPAARRPSRS